MSPGHPGAGEPSRWNVADGAVIGSVLTVRDLGQPNAAESLYVLLRDGATGFAVRRLTPAIGELVRDVAPIQVAPTNFARYRRWDVAGVVLPGHSAAPGGHCRQRHHLPGVVEGRWQTAPPKSRSCRGKGCRSCLGSADNRLVKLPKGVRDPESVEADQVYIGPWCHELVMTTSAAPAASSREAMWWIFRSRGPLRHRVVRRRVHGLGVSPDPVVPGRHRGR